MNDRTRTLRITQEDIDALAALVMTEVGGWTDVQLQTGAAAVVDTALNRVGTRRGRETISRVINEPWQFTGVTRAGGWQNVQTPQAIRDAVVAHLAAREAGEPSTVGGATHFLNPNQTTDRDGNPVPPPRWGRTIVANPVLVIGAGRDAHYHGTPSGERGAAPVSVQIEEGERRRLEGTGRNLGDMARTAVRGVSDYLTQSQQSVPYWGRSSPDWSQRALEAVRNPTDLFGMFPRATGSPVPVPPPVQDRPPVSSPDNRPPPTGLRPEDSPYAVPDAVHSDSPNGLSIGSQGLPTTGPMAPPLAPPGAGEAAPLVPRSRFELGSGPIGPSQRTPLSRGPIFRAGPPPSLVPPSWPSDRLRLRPQDYDAGRRGSNDPIDSGAPVDAPAQKDRALPTFDAGRFEGIPQQDQLRRVLQELAAARGTSNAPTDGEAPLDAVAPGQALPTRGLARLADPDGHMAAALRLLELASTGSLQPSRPPWL